MTRSCRRRTPTHWARCPTPRPSRASPTRAARTRSRRRTRADAADLDPEKNPAVDAEAPAVLKEGEDTDTEATKGGEDVAPEHESPA